MTLVTVLFLASGFLLSVQYKASERDRQALQGTWVLLTAERWGEKTDQGATMDERALRLDYLRREAEERSIEPDPTKYRTTLTFKGNGYVFEQAGETTAEGTYKLDVTKKRKVIERTKPSIRVRDDVYYSLYSVDDDTLIWCFNIGSPSLLKNVPARFATDEKDETTVILTFKRLSPRAESLPVHDERLHQKNQRPTPRAHGLCPAPGGMFSRPWRHMPVSHRCRGPRKHGDTADRRLP
jgi:uncharacterized protein (TIGR03067 family)